MAVAEYWIYSVLYCRHGVLDNHREFLFLSLSILLLQNLSLRVSGYFSILESLYLGHRVFSKLQNVCSHENLQ